MFGRWSRRQNPPLPDLDSEVAAHWNRGNTSSKAPGSEESLDTSLDFPLVNPRSPKRTREDSRRRRRLAVSLLIGLLLAPIVVIGAYQLVRHINPMTRVRESLGERMTFGPQDDEEIFYTEDISPEQARRLGAFLQEEGLFDGLSAKSVRLSRNGAVFVVGFAVEWNSWEQPEVVAYFRQMQTRLSKGAFDGSPVEIHLCARQADSKGQQLPAMSVLQADGAP
jgi:hypothetical protein